MLLRARRFHIFCIPRGLGVSIRYLVVRYQICGECLCNTWIVEIRLPGPLSGDQEDASHTSWSRHGSIIDSLIAAKSNGAATACFRSLVSRAAWVAEADDVIRLVACAAEALARCRRGFRLWHHNSADVAGRAFYLLFLFIAPNNAMT